MQYTWKKVENFSPISINIVLEDLDDLENLAMVLDGNKNFRDLWKTLDNLVTEQHEK